MLQSMHCVEGIRSWRGVGRRVTSALLSAVIACGASTVAPASLDGTWLLEAFDNSPVPVVAAQDSVTTLTIMGGVLTMHASSSQYELHLYTSITHRGAVTVDTTTYGGGYTLSGSTISLGDGPYDPTTVSGSTITITGTSVAPTGQMTPFSYRFQHQ